MKTILSEKDYQHVPAEQRERLQTFRTSHPRQYTNLLGAEWSYLIGGQGAETMLILPGGERIGDVAFPLMQRFEQEYRCLYRRRCWSMLCAQVSRPCKQAHFDEYGHTRRATWKSNKIYKTAGNNASSRDGTRAGKYLAGKSSLSTTRRAAFLAHTDAGTGRTTNASGYGEFIRCDYRLPAQLPLLAQ